MDNYRIVYKSAGQQYVLATCDTKEQALALLQETGEDAPGAKVQELADKWGDLEWVDLEE